MYIYKLKQIKSIFFINIMFANYKRRKYNIFNTHTHTQIIYIHIYTIILIFSSLFRKLMFPNIH